MDAQREKRTLEIFAAVQDLPDDLRTPRLDELCGHDQALRQEVEELLRHDRETHDLDTPFAAAAEVIVANEDPLVPGDLLGRYRVVERIGVGGMAIVYRAEHVRIGLSVAIKVLPSGFVRGDQIERLRREARILARLRHPGIARVYDARVHRERAGSLSMTMPYIVMELVDGTTLFDHCSRLSRDDRLRVLRLVCDAVQAAHQQGVVHRDLKPSNVLVDAAGHPKVIDFGLATLAPAASASLTRWTDVLPGFGTLPYVSPEQLQGLGDVDARADVYALGVLLYHLLTDRLPIAVDSCPTVRDIVRLCTELPPPPSRWQPGLPEELDWITRKALAADRNQRYESAGALGEDLARLAANLPTTAMPPTMMSEVRRHLRRRRGLVVAASSVFLALVLGIVATSLQAARAGREQQRASRALELMRDTSQVVVARLGSIAAEPSAAARAFREQVLRDLLPPLTAIQREFGALWPSRETTNALVTLFDLSLARGDLDVARLCSESALAAAQAVTNALPGDAEASTLLGAAQWCVGEIAARQGTRAAAVAAFEQAVAACEIGASSGSVSSRRWLVRARGRLANAMAAAGSIGAAVALHVRTVAQQRALVDSGGGTARDLADALLDLAAVLDRRGDSAEREQALVEVARLHQRLDGMPDAARVDPVETGQLARAKQLLAGSAIARGDFEQALSWAAAATRHWSELHAADPDDARLARPYVECLRTNCGLLRKLGRPEEALTAATRAVDLARAAVAKDQRDLDWAFVLAAVLIDQVNVLRAGQRDVTSPLEEAIAILRRLLDIEARPEFESALATAATVQAQALRERGRHEEGLAAAELACDAQRKQLARSPGNLELMRKLNGALRVLGRMRLELERLDGARAAFSEAETGLVALREQQPENDAHLAAARYTALQLGYVEATGGNAAAACRHFERARDLCRERLARAPGDLDNRAFMAQVLNELGEHSGNGEASIRYFDESLQVQLAVEDLGDVGNRFRRMLLESFARMAGECIRAGKHDRAIECLQEILPRASGADGWRAEQAESALRGVDCMRSAREPEFATDVIGVADALCLARRHAEADAHFDRALGGKAIEHESVELWLRAAVAAAMASRVEPGRATHALDLLRACVSQWRMRNAETERLIAANEGDAGALAAERQVLQERLRAVRSDEYGFLHLRSRPEWSEIFLESR